MGEKKTLKMELEWKVTLTSTGKGMSGRREGIAGGGPWPILLG